MYKRKYNEYYKNPTNSCEIIKWNIEDGRRLVREGEKGCLESVVEWLSFQPTELKKMCVVISN